MNINQGFKTSLITLIIALLMLGLVLAACAPPPGYNSATGQVETPQPTLVPFGRTRVYQDSYIWVDKFIDSVDGNVCYVGQGETTLQGMAISCVPIHQP